MYSFQLNLLNYDNEERLRLKYTNIDDEVDYDDEDDDDEDEEEADEEEELYTVV